MRISIVGFGKVGSHLFDALQKSAKYQPILKIRNAKDLKKNVRKLRNTEVIFITTQDANIKKAAKKISQSNIDFKGKFVYHTSGVLTSDELKTLKKQGSEIGSFHPVQTFEEVSKKNSGRLKGVYIVIEGTKKAVITANEIAKAIGAEPVTIEKKDKIMHHISSVIASNYLIALLHGIEIIRKRIQKSGFNKHSFLSIYEPLIRQTIENVEKKGAVKSLTGPIERNDLAGVKLHLKELRKRMPELVDFYKFLGSEAAKIAREKRSLGKKDYKKILAFLTR